MLRRNKSRENQKQNQRGWYSSSSSGVREKKRHEELNMSSPGSRGIYKVGSIGLREEQTRWQGIRYPADSSHYWKLDWTFFGGRRRSRTSIAAGGAGSYNRECYRPPRDATIILAPHDAPERATQQSHDEAGSQASRGKLFTARARRPSHHHITVQL